MFQPAQRITVDSIDQLREILTPGSGHAPPFRPMGAGSSATDCNTTTVGTVLDMSGLDNIVDIDSYNHRITVQAGARISQVVDALAVHGMELEGSHDLVDRTVGGAVAGGCIGPVIGSDGALFASQVLSVKAVTPEGKLLVADIGQQNILNVLRLSYGMLGAICEVTLRARPIMGFSATHRRCSIEQFSNAVEKLARTQLGLKFFMMPFRDRVYLDLRRFDAQAKAMGLPWKIKDWGESTVLPTVFKSLNRIIPVSGVRYRLIDRVSSMTQGLVSNRLVSGGNISTAKSSGGAKSLRYSTWFFPACDFAVLVQAYREFCERIRAESGFRCDMPTVGYLLGCDRSSILSPCFDEPMVALRAVSTQSRGWDDFAIDFGEFAANWGGMPLFNQSLELGPDYARTAFGKRLAYFRKVRRQVDPENRLMNPYLSQYFL
ncbi:MAG: FAD-dependent oxidoreductase [Woeseiaceae bacterium]|nr:FAD-dependent oxidoreductase [Woeseiaceae bacterium]